REAHAAARLRSRNAVSIFDHGVRGRVAFIAMELLQGESLEERLATRGVLSAEALVRTMTQVAKAVDEAHALGILHRDLKPSNVFLATQDGEEIVKVLDFGLAKLLAVSEALEVETEHGQIVGTPAYMSPEQVTGDKLDHRSDLWQLAIVAFECVTGRRPFES